MRLALKLLATTLLLVSIQVSALPITVKANVSGSEKPTISGTTNLPDGIEFLVTIERKENQFMAQSKASAKGGSFQAGPFSQKGQGLNPGVYTLQVMMLAPPLQPKATHSVIGERGEKLEGPLVYQAPIGGKSIIYKTTFKIGGGKASSEKDKAAREQEAEDKHSWWLNSCNSTCSTTQTLAIKEHKTFDMDRCYAQCVAREPSKK